MNQLVWWWQGSSVKEAGSSSSVHQRVRGQSGKAGQDALPRQPCPHMKLQQELAFLACL